MREFWEKINQRYLLFYDADLNEDMEAVVLSIFEKPGVFTDVVMRSSRDIVESDGEQMRTVIGTGVEYTIIRSIPYGAFLTRIMRATNIPIATLHRALIAYSKKHGAVENKYINESTVSVFCAEFQDWKTKHLQGHFRYNMATAALWALVNILRVVSLFLCAQRLQIGINPRSCIKMRKMSTRIYFLHFTAIYFVKICSKIVGYSLNEISLFITCAAILTVVSYALDFDKLSWSKKLF